ncbi:MAG: WhiB family transcriptional regulator, redox-sensing transcriptional regulator [Patescibacteria group bacterium]|nr:WhiB family transcriptional regulator, redox-sensing transcriptional regulator [Patescibacteria group bacterium]
MPIAAITGHTDQAMAPRPELSVMEPPQTLTMADINLAMRESLQRTAQLSPLDNHIPLFDPSVLEEGNQRALDRYGDDARRLLIIGPDVVSFEGMPPTILERQYSGRFLGALIVVREMSLLHVYRDTGDYTDEDVSPLTARKIRDELAESLVDWSGRSAISRSGKAKGTRSGMPDVLVMDIRHSEMYKEAINHIVFDDEIQRYIANGVNLPQINNDKEAGWLMSSIARVNQGDLSLEARQRIAFLSLLLVPESDMASGLRANGLLEQTTEELRARRNFISKHFSEEAWADQALCSPTSTTDITTNDFYQRPNERLKDYKARKKQLVEMFCANCVVRDECADYAIRTRQPEGIWGGLDTVELGVTKRRNGRRVG